jgi:dTDP-4-dehydrorhamnose 3,5-epimerase
VIEGPATFCSIQSGSFDAASDAGIRWDTVGIPWVSATPVISDRDAALPALEDFDSPFVLGGARDVG